VKNVCMLSAFRHSLPAQIERYFRQADAYRNALKERGWGFRLRLVEGDSGNNDVWIRIANCAKRYDIECYLRDASHGGPVFGSIVSKERFEALSKVGNWMLEQVQSDDDVVVYVESDLIWHEQTMLHLGAQLLDYDLDIVSPLIMAGENFYDVWAFRGLDRAHFAPFKPYHRSLAEGFALRNREGLTELYSVGSCLVMKGEVARTCRIIDNNCLVGFCEDARTRGYKVWVDTRVKVSHP
jgi:hypothetical protein